MFRKRFVLPLVIVSLGPCISCLADGDFEKPTRLSADGETIDTGEAWGHSGPCVEDVDGDGLRDLVVGDFGGKFRLYRNVGKKDTPKYQDAGFIQASNEEAKVRIYCCVGSQARFADLNGDGFRDLISNSYDPGHCYVFHGMQNHEFASGEELLDKSGVPVRSSPDQQQDHQSFGSFFTPIDWDADGDYDLLIGCFDGHLKLRINEGNAENASFATENQTINAGEAPLKVEAHCCPVVADWDGDGLWDILSGSDDGSVTWFRNRGTKEAPQLDVGQVLIEKHPTHGYHLLMWNDAEIVPGIRSQIDVVDYNNDGKLDLLLGDFFTAYEPRKDLGQDEKEQLEHWITERTNISKAFADQMATLRNDFRERYPGDMIFSDEADERWSIAYKALKDGPEYQEMVAGETEWANQVRPFLARTRGQGDRVHDLPLSHGYVWLFIRK